VCKERCAVAVPGGAGLEARVTLPQPADSPLARGREDATKRHVSVQMPPVRRSVPGGRVRSSSVPLTTGVLMVFGVPRRALPLPASTETRSAAIFTAVPGFEGEAARNWRGASAPTRTFKINTAPKWKWAVGTQVSTVRIKQRRDVFPLCMVKTKIHEWMELNNGHVRILTSGGINTCHFWFAQSSSLHSPSRVLCSYSEGSPNRHIGNTCMAWFWLTWSRFTQRGFYATICVIVLEQLTQ